MNKKIRIESKQLALLMGASLLTDAFIQPFGRETTIYTAQIGIFSAAIQMLVISFAFWLLCTLGNSILKNKVTVLLFLIISVLSVALEIIQGERFYSYVMQSELSVGMFLGIIFLAGFYGVYSGLDALSRTASIILTLTTFSILLLVISIASQLRFTNLQPASFELNTIGNAVLSQLYLPPELFFWSILRKESNQNNSSHANKVFGGLFVASSLFSLLGEMTMGKAYQEQEHPLFTIARLGGISVFRRLDALHISIWLLLFLVKVTVYFAMIVLLIKKVFPTLKSYCPYYVVVVGVLGVFLATWSQAENTAYWIQQATLIALFIITLLLPVTKKEQS